MLECPARPPWWGDGVEADYHLVVKCIPHGNEIGQVAGIHISFFSFLAHGPSVSAGLRTELGRAVFYSLHSLSIMKEWIGHTLRTKKLLIAFLTLRTCLRKAKESETWIT